MKHAYSVLIGRFQPFHNAHAELLEKALEVARHTIVVLGSDRSARTTRNPWSPDERAAMIRAHLGEYRRDRVTFLRLRDYLYNDQQWIADLQQQVREITGSESVALVGYYKDRTSYYLRCFPQWDAKHIGFQRRELAATDIRHKYFTGDAAWQTDVPDATCYALQSFYRTPDYDRLRDEYAFVLGYRKLWEPAPFPPTFVTVDAVVVCSGHLLVVRRGAQPGRGTIALPGGFVGQDERIVDAVFRELKEETGIRFPSDEARKHVVETRVFDHPDRSSRGRTITHAYLIKLPDGELPQVKGESDADKAWWLPISDVAVRENEFFEDHAHIAMNLLTRL